LEQVHDAVLECPVFLLIGSKVSVRSHQILREVELAHAEQRIIIPVLLDLTIDEFRCAHKILKVVTGTTVPLIASGVDAGQLATRIDTALASRGVVGTQKDPLPSLWELLPDFERRRLNFSSKPLVEQTCWDCGGTGKWASRQKPGKWNKCKKCNGTGRMMGPDMTDVKFPPST
jgi:hypothetical protein